MPPIWRRGEIAIDEVRLQIGFDERHDDDELIDVGDQHVFAFSRGAGQNAVPRLDALDHAFAVARVRGTRRDRRW